MKKLKLFGFENLPEGFSVGEPLTGYGLAYSDMPSVAPSTAATVPAPRIVNDRIIVGKPAANPSQLIGPVMWPLKLFVGDVTPVKVIIGIRMEKIATFGGPYVLCFNSVLSGSSASLMAPFTDADFAGFNRYYELVFDFVANTVSAYADGVFIRYVSIPAALRSAGFKNGYLQCGTPSTAWVSNNAGTPTDVLAWSDIYCLTDDGTGGNDPIQPLGPITVKRVPLVSASGSGYSPPSGSTVVGALNTSREDTASLAAPKVGVPSDNTPLRLKVDVSVLGNVTILGVDAKVASAKDAAGDQTLSGSISVNGSSTSPISIAMTAGATPVNVSVGSLAALLDGSKFTKADLANLELVITPAT